MSIHDELNLAQNEFINDIELAWTNGSAEDRARIEGYLNSIKDNFKKICACIEQNPTSNFLANANLMKNHYRQENWPIKFAVIFLERAEMETTVSRILKKPKELERYARGVESGKDETGKIIHQVFGVPSSPIEILARINLNLYGYCTKEKGKVISVECNVPELANDDKYYPTIYLCTESIKAMPQDYKCSMQEVETICGNKIEINANYFATNGEKLVFAHEFGHLILNHASIQPTPGFESGETQANFMASLLLFDETASAYMKFKYSDSIEEYQHTCLLYIDFAPNDIAQKLFEILVKRVSYDKFPPDIKIKKPGKKKVRVGLSGGTSDKLPPSQKPVIEMIIREITNVLITEPAVNYKVFSVNPGSWGVSFKTYHLDKKYGKLSDYIKTEIHFETSGCGNRQEDEQFFVGHAMIKYSTPDPEFKHLSGGFGLTGKQRRIMSQDKDYPETIYVSKVYDPATNTVDTSVICSCVSILLTRIENEL